MHVGLFLSPPPPSCVPITCREVVQMSEQYSDQMWARSQRNSQVQTEEQRRVSEWAFLHFEIRLWNEAQRDVNYSSYNPSFDLKKRSADPTDLYPLPDGVVGGRPAVLLVVETRAFGGPVGVVLGGGADLVWGNLPRLHTQRLRAGKSCRGQKNSIKTSKA